MSTGWWVRRSIWRVYAMDIQSPAFRSKRTRFLSSICSWRGSFSCARYAHRARLCTLGWTLGTWSLRWSLPRRGGRMAACSTATTSSTGSCSTFHTSVSESRWDYIYRDIKVRLCVHVAFGYFNDLHIKCSQYGCFSSEGNIWRQDWVQAWDHTCIVNELMFAWKRHLFIWHFESFLANPSTRAALFFSFKAWFSIYSAFDIHWISFFVWYLVEEKNMPKIDFRDMIWSRTDTVVLFLETTTLQK